jgi:hypothetical protein
MELGSILSITRGQMPYLCFCKHMASREHHALYEKQIFTRQHGHKLSASNLEVQTDSEGNNHCGQHAMLSSKIDLPLVICHILC